MKRFKLLFLITTFLCSNFMFSAYRDQQKEQKKQYTVGIKIPNETNVGKAFNPVHMTITYLGEADEKTLTIVRAALKKINKLRPLQFRIGEPDQFGAKKDVPVVRLEIEDTFVEELLLQMHQNLGVKEEWQDEKFERPSWHVSARDTNLRRELLAKKGTLITGGELFIKPLGPFDPIDLGFSQD